MWWHLCSATFAIECVLYRGVVTPLLRHFRYLHTIYTLSTHTNLWLSMICDVLMCWRCMATITRPLHDRCTHWYTGNGWENVFCGWQSMIYDVLEVNGDRYKHRYMSNEGKQTEKEVRGCVCVCTTHTHNTHIHTHSLSHTHTHANTHAHT